MTDAATPDAREISDASIRAYAAVLIQDYAADLDYLDLAEHMAIEDSIGGVLLTDLDGPEIDDVQRRILDAAHSAEIASSWPDEQQPAGATGPSRDVVVEGAVRDLGKLADAWLGWFDSGQDGESPSMPERRIEIADHLGRVRIVLNELKRLTDRVAHLDSARDSAVRAWKQEHDGADDLQRERDTWKSEAERRSAERKAASRRVGILRAWLYELGHAPDAVDERLRRDAAALAAQDERETGR